MTLLRPHWEEPDQLCCVNGATAVFWIDSCKHHATCREEIVQVLWQKIPKNLTRSLHKKCNHKFSSAADEVSRNEQTTKEARTQLFPQNETSKNATVNCCMCIVCCGTLSTSKNGVGVVVCCPFECGFARTLWLTEEAFFSEIRYFSMFACSYSFTKYS